MRLKVGGPSGLRKTTMGTNSLAHRTTWLRSDFYHEIKEAKPYKLAYGMIVVISRRPKRS